MKLHVITRLASHCRRLPHCRDLECMWPVCTPFLSSDAVISIARSRDSAIASSASGAVEEGPAMTRDGSAGRHFRFSGVRTGSGKGHFLATSGCLSHPRSVRASTCMPFAHVSLSELLCVSRGISQPQPYLFRSPATVALFNTSVHPPAFPSGAAVQPGTCGNLRKHNLSLSKEPG